MPGRSPPRNLVSRPRTGSISASSHHVASPVNDDLQVLQSKCSADLFPVGRQVRICRYREGRRPADVERLSRQNLLAATGMFAREKEPSISMRFPAERVYLVKARDIDLRAVFVDGMAVNAGQCTFLAATDETRRIDYDDRVFERIS